MLSDKRKRFCEEYVKDPNGSEAAIRAGYAKKTCRQSAHEILTIPDAIDYIEKIQAKIAKRNKITIDELIQDLAEIKNINIVDLYDENGFLKELHELPKEFTKCIQEITETKMKYGKDTEKAVTKVKFYSRLDAIEKLAKHLGFYERDNEQKRATGFEIEIINGRKDQDTSE